MSDDVRLDKLPLTQSLVLEVLAARCRLGEQVWPFPNRAKQALDALARVGLVGHQGGIVEGTRNAWLTDKGRTAVLSDTYMPPAGASATQCECGADRFHPPSHASDCPAFWTVGASNTDVRFLERWVKRS